MKVLWLCNIVLPDFSASFQMDRNPYGGWMSGLAHQLKQNSELELGFCFPVFHSSLVKKGIVNKQKYYSFLFLGAAVHNKAQLARFQEILADFQPDIVHIWGTEYAHASAMAHACDILSLLDRTVIHIQGLASVYANHYFAGVPQEYLGLRSEGVQTIEEGRNGLFERGKYEIQLLENIRHVIGRTDWDKACVLQVNPTVQYHFCNEILRDVFYERMGEWNIKNCERQSIFASQAAYPIKGLHCLLKAMPAVLARFPDAHVYVGGEDPTGMTEYGLNLYGFYICSLLQELQLEKHVTFTGLLPEAEMAERFLKSNVFVSPSSIENSSNSVCEAMLLGVPVVASYVGGTSNILEDKTDGFLYQFDAEYMLAYYICNIFEDDELATKLSANAAQKMHKLANRERNAAVTYEIYREIVSRSIG